MKKFTSFGLICNILGTVVGAGFASGQEVLTYFTRFGIISYLFCVVAGVLFSTLIYLYLSIGKLLPKNNLIMQLLYILLYFSCFIFLGSMFAGNYEIFLNSSDKIIALIVNFLILLISYFIIVNGIGFITKINIFLMPVLLIVVLVVSVLFIKTNFIYEFIETKVNIKQVVFGGVSCFTYISFNFISLGMFLINESKNYNKSQIIKTSIISGFIIFLFLFIINLSLRLYNVSFTTLPMLIIAFKINKIVGVLMLLAIFIGISTSLLTTAYVLYNGFDVKKNNKYLCLFILIIGFLISFFGFAFIVKNFYFMIGIFGFIFIIYGCVSYFKKLLLKN